MNDQKRSEFAVGLAKLINNLSLENESGTPDFILVDYLIGCLDAFDAATRARTKWFAVPVSDEVASGGG